MTYRAKWTDVPERGSESWDAAEESEADDEEEEGEKDRHVVTRGAALSCHGYAFISPGYINCYTATSCKHLNTHIHTHILI